MMISVLVGVTRTSTPSFLDHLRTLGIVSFCPVVPCSRSPKHKVVWFEKWSHRWRLDHINGPWLQVNQTCSWNVSLSCRSHVHGDFV